MKLQHLSLLLFLVLVLTLVGCRRHGALEDKPQRAVPGNAQEAAQAWPGTRITFTDTEGKLILKLRKRHRSSTKVFGAKQQTLGYVRRNGQNQIVVTRPDPNKPGYLIQQMPPKDGQTDALLHHIHPTLPAESNSLLRPKADTTTLIASIHREPPQTLKGCPSWHVKDAQGSDIAHLTQEPIPESGHCNTDDATWKVVLTDQAPDKGEQHTFWLSKGPEPVRTLQGTSKAPSSKAAQPEGQTAFRLLHTQLPTLATAPMLLPGDDLLLKASLITLLDAPLEDQKLAQRP